MRKLPQHLLWLGSWAWLGLVFNFVRPFAGGLGALVNYFLGSVLHFPAGLFSSLACGVRRILGVLLHSAVVGLGKHGERNEQREKQRQVLCFHMSSMTSS